MKPGRYIRLDRFFKKLFAINQDWFNVRKNLTEKEAKDLSAMVDNAASAVRDIEFMFKNKLK